MRPAHLKRVNIYVSQVSISERRSLITVIHPKMKKDVKCQTQGRCPSQSRHAR